MNRKAVLFPILYGALFASQAAQAGAPVGEPLPVHSLASPLGHDIGPTTIIGLQIDATDTNHRVITVHETIPVSGRSDVTLLYPKWSPGDLAPNGPIDHLVDLHIVAGDQTLKWQRHTDDAYKFRVAVPPDVKALNVSYQIVSSLDADQGVVLMDAHMLDLQWPTLLLYPADQDPRYINYDVSVALPPGWKFASALSGLERGRTLELGTVSFDKLADSPLMAAPNVTQIDIKTGANPVRLSLASDGPDTVTAPPGLVEGYSRLVSEAEMLFGRPPYDHYDILEWLSGKFGPVYYEHKQSLESNMPLDTFQAWNSRPDIRTLFAHDYVHVWNGILRRPREMTAEDFNEPVRADMVWMTEGLTEYWRNVLAVRAGLITHQDYLDGLADLAAQESTSAGASWRPLGDLGADAVIASSSPEPWPDWRRFKSEAYGQGRLIWLEVDSLIRQRSNDRRSLDDFAKRFFDTSSDQASTYDLADVIKALNEVAPYDWAGFFKSRVDDVDATPGLMGLEQSGYRLVYTAHPSDLQASTEMRRGFPILRYSLGLTVDGTGSILSVAWNSPAWRSGISPGGTITSVNGLPYSNDNIRNAASPETAMKITLVVKKDSVEKNFSFESSGGLRYPHLERVSGRKPLLDAALISRVPSRS